MSDTLADEIAELPSLSRAQLRMKWRDVLKKEPPAHLRKQLLVPLLAYKMQEQAYGGLRPEVKRRLRELADSFESEPKRASAKLAAQFRIKPGTRLIRQWQGETHHVTVCDQGFEYNGQKYSSLAEVARSLPICPEPEPSGMMLMMTLYPGSRPFGFPCFPYSVISMACFGNTGHTITIIAKASLGNGKHLAELPRVDDGAISALIYLIPPGSARNPAAKPRSW